MQEMATKGICIGMIFLYCLQLTIISCHPKWFTTSKVSVVIRVTFGTEEINSIKG